MAKLWNWLKGNDRNAEELAAARERVARAQHALLPYSAALDAAARARVQAAETRWHAAREVEQRGEAEAAARALADYGEVASELEGVRNAVAAQRPELVARELLARATLQADGLDDPEARCGAQQAVLSVLLEAGELAAAEALLAPIFEVLEAERLPGRLLWLEAVLHAALRRGVEAPWLAPSHARVLELLLAARESLEEGEEDPLFELLAAQVARKDLASARATLPRIEGDLHEEALLLLAEGAALAGELEEARALLGQIRSASVHRRAEVSMLGALAEGPRAAEAVDAARALLDPEARRAALAGVAAVRAHAGDAATARALLDELEAEQREDVALALFEAEIGRGEFVAAGETFRALRSDKNRAQAWRRVAEEVSALEDEGGALELIRWIEEPLLQARALESRAWARLRAGDEGAFRKLFGMALELAGEAARGQGPARQPGGMPAAWILLAARAQLALGDAQAALNCARTFRAQLPEAWSDFGFVCGTTTNLEALDLLSEGTPSPAERTTLLCATALSLLRRTRDEPDGERR